MTREEAREQAMNWVFVAMTRGDIEYGCRKRGIQVVKSRATMEKKLIDALTEEIYKASL